MDIRRFDRSKLTGTLVPITDDWAFVPAPLPPKGWSVELSLWPLLSEAKAELAELNGVGRTLPNPEILLRPLQNREALRSSSLEGTYATPQELLLFELDPEAAPSAKASAHQVNSWREVYNYARALTVGTDLLQNYPLSLRVIRSMHDTLMRGVRGNECDPGEFRRVQVHIGADRRYVPPPHPELDDSLDKFEKYLNLESELDPLARAFLTHYQFEAIHPFRDGNGRVGRALLSLTIFKWLNHRHPWLYLSPFFEKHKDEYIDRMFNVSATGAWDAWIEFCLKATIEQCRDASRRCDELIQVRKDFHARLESAAKKSERSYQIVEMLFTNPMLDVGEVRKRFSVTYPTAKTDLERLSELGIVEALKDYSPRTYVATKVFDIAYQEVEFTR